MTTEKSLTTTTGKGVTRRESLVPKLFSGSLVPQERERGLALVKLGFDPAMHLAVYQGRVTLTIAARYWWARTKSPNRVDFRVVSEPIQGKEMREAYGIKEHEIGVIARIYLRGETEPTCSGFGRASRDSKQPVIRGSAVEADHPYRLAEKRAEAQALDKLCPVGVSVVSPEEAMEMEGLNPPLATAPKAPEYAYYRARQLTERERETEEAMAKAEVDPETGEIVTPPAVSEPAVPGPEVPPARAEAEKPAAGPAEAKATSPRAPSGDARQAAWESWQRRGAAISSAEGKVAEKPVIPVFQNKGALMTWVVTTWPGKGARDVAKALGVSQLADSTATMEEIVHTLVELWGRGA